MKKHLLKVGSVLLALLMLLCCLAACGETKTESTLSETETSSASESSETVSSGSGIDETATPVLKLRVNEKYYVTLDLTPYLGQDNVWVDIPVEVSMLTSGVNQFALTSNTYNHGNKVAKSLDVYFTMAEAGIDSFVSSDVMSTWELFADRYLNLKLSVSDGENWTEIPTGETFAQDESIVVGLYVPNDTMYNTCRNITLDKLDGVKEAKVSVNLHVGSTLLEAPEPEPVDEGEGSSPLDSTVPVLKVKLNGAVYERLDLTPYLGQENVWVTVPLNFEKLREGNNRIALDSNVDNTGNFCDQSVDIYCSKLANAVVTSDELSTDGLLSWVVYPDRYLNLYLELHDTATGEWVKVPENESFDLYEHTVIGLFNTPDYTSPFNFRRIIPVADLSKYDDARAVINLHVGNDLSIK